MWSELRGGSQQPDQGRPSRKEKEEPDNLDALLRSLSSEPAAPRRTSSVEARDHGKGAIADASDASEDLTEDEGEAFERIEKLRYALADATVSEAAAKILNQQPPSEWLAYYEDRPQLALYTIEHEIQRNTYNVDEEALRRMLEQGGPRAFLVRLANQSIFADAVAALSEALRPHGLDGAAVGADKGGSYEFGRDSLDAALDLDVSVPTDDNPQGKLVLATVTTRIHVRTDWHVVRRIDRPTLAPIFEDRTKRAARCFVQARNAEPRVSEAAAGTIVGPARVLGAAFSGVDALGKLVRRSAADFCRPDDLSNGQPPGHGSSSGGKQHDISSLLASRFDD